MVAEFDHDQWPRRCTGFVEGASNKLSLFVELRTAEAVCDVFVDELSDRVELEVLACRTDGTDEPGETDIYLHAPLGDRRVIDLASGTTVPPRRT